MWRKKKIEHNLTEEQLKSIDDYLEAEKKPIIEIEEESEIIKDFDYYVEEYIKDYDSALEPADDPIEESARQFFLKKLQFDLQSNGWKRYKNRSFI